MKLFFMEIVNKCLSKLLSWVMYDNDNWEYVKDMASQLFNGFI
jgi:hypothetical protein